MAFLFGLAPGGVYHATYCYQLRGALLPHHFTLTRIDAGGIFSVALSVGSRLPGVTWHPALWSPDFPPFRHQAEARLPGRLPAVIVLHPAIICQCQNVLGLLLLHTVYLSAWYGVQFRSNTRRLGSGQVFL